MLYATIWNACGNIAPTEEQVFFTIQNDSIIAKDDLLELKSVSILSSSFVDQNFEALLQIDFISRHESQLWRNKGRKDFIPANMQVVKGFNTVKVTTTLGIAITGDRSWHIESFKFHE